VIGRAVVVVLAAVAAAGVTLAGQGAAPTRYGYAVVATYPHDPGAFTQGLVYRDGVLFESTGLRGESTLREVRLETGQVVRQRALSRQYFAEGLALWEDRLVQLTWTSGLGFVWDTATFEAVRTFGYAGEGWGLAQDGRRLILSDGTEWLRFFDPATLAETGRVRVTDGGRSVRNLNELEYIDGVVYANGWQTDRIAMIDADTGRVEGWIDLEGLLPADRRRGVDVLNGIAWDPDGRRLFVTGKLWPDLFEIRLIPQ
jgi:glutaminyl-peptide cyclotransferase